MPAEHCSNAAAFLWFLFFSLNLISRQSDFCIVVLEARVTLAPVAEATRGSDSARLVPARALPPGA